jgi:acyl carrier protein
VTSVTDLEAALRSAIARVAPDVDVDALDPDADFRETTGLDSMDFLNVLIALRELTGIEIPERDYPQLSSLRSFDAYLSGVSPG